MRCSREDACAVGTEAAPRSTRTSRRSAVGLRASHDADVLEHIYCRNILMF